VIDATTAAEVALGMDIATRLQRRGAPAEFIARAIKQANGIIGCVELDGSLGAALPVSKNQVQTRLAEPRNRAVHAADPVDLHAAQLALKVAREIVRSVRPLSEL
jgi:hypothetical protein